MPPPLFFSSILLQHTPVVYTTLVMIELKNVSKEIGGRTVVRDVSLTIPTGVVFGFLGPNGAGKTTTIKMLVGLNHPTVGQVRVGGSMPTDKAARARIGFMPETPQFYDHLSGLEFLRFCGELFSAHTDEAQYFAALERLGIFEAKDQKISTYSKGMKQRLGFAQALLNDPQYLFLDEPLDGLDPLGRKALKTIITELKAQGKTIFFNSHILFDTQELCDQIGVLHQGSLLYAGSVGDFTRGKTLEEQFVTTIESLGTTI